MPTSRIEITSSGASPQEAAAVVAAVEQFLRDHAPAIVSAEPAVPAWKRAALLEGVGLHPELRDHSWM